MSERTYVRSNGKTDGRMNGDDRSTNGRMDGLSDSKTGGRTSGQTTSQPDKRLQGQFVGRKDVQSMTGRCSNQYSFNIPLLATTEPYSSLNLKTIKSKAKRVNILVEISKQSVFYFKLYILAKLNKSHDNEHNN